MLIKPDARPVFSHLVRKVSQFRSDEGGAIAIFVLMIFVMMLFVGGIAVDVMRSEMRRVTYQQTFDRAVLAAANIVLPADQTPTMVGQDWYSKAGIGDEFTVDYITPTITGTVEKTGTNTSSSREAKAVGMVRSYNWFMHMLDVPYFNIPVESTAKQGVSKIEVILALDITGSMGQSAGSLTKIEALRQAATNFVNILKFNKDGSGNYTIDKDPNKLISIGMVPYASNVNIPVDLRNQFTFTQLANYFDQPAGTGVPNINCFEIPPSTFGSTALSTTVPLEMAAVADTDRTAISPTTKTNSAGGVVEYAYGNPVGPSRSSGRFVCNHGDNASTAKDETKGNLVLLPTTVPATVTDQIKLLEPLGSTSIAVGMRWATALMDETARPIYTNLRGGELAMAGRPANNTDNETRKIIVLMTDGDHYLTKHVYAYKAGPSPIWRGADGKYAIKYTSGGQALTGGTRPGLSATSTCSGWNLGTTRNYFIPHLKNEYVMQKTGSDAEGSGKGSNIKGACDPLAWKNSPTWTGSGTARQLDWSEVWRYVKVDWVVEQLYMRSGVGGTGSYSTVYNTFVQDYLTSEPYMDELLNTNCTAAKNAGFEVFGIVLGDDVVETPIKNCSSPGTGYYYKTNDPASLTAAFEQIAVLISELRLTQ